MEGEALKRSELFGKIRKLKNPSAITPEEDADLQSTQKSLLSFAAGSKSPELLAHEYDLKQAYEKRKRNQPAPADTRNPCIGSIGSANCKK